MENRFTKIASIFAASMLFTFNASAVSTTASRDNRIYDYQDEMYVVSVDLQEESECVSEPEKLAIKFDISTDSDGYTYIDFIVDKPTEVMDLEFPMSFYDHIENAMSDPVDVDVIDGYTFQKGAPSGKIVDDEGYPFYTYQLVRFDGQKHTVSGTVLSLKFAFEPMYVWCDAPQIPVMSYYWLNEKESDDGKYIIATQEFWACVDMPLVNISHLKEHEKQINDLNSQIEELKNQLKQIECTKNTADGNRYDYNGDGKVTIADVVLLMRYINEN